MEIFYDLSIYMFIIHILQYARLTNIQLYLKVICNGYFGDNNFPIDKLRKDVEILSIVPTSSKCINVGSRGETRCELVENQLTLGPIYKVCIYS